MAVWPYNTRGWKRLRLNVLHAEPLCRYCYRRGKITPATLVDHIVPVKADESRVFDTDNLQPLCAHCHNTHKQSAERRGYEAGVSQDGLPVDPNHPFNR